MTDKEKIILDYELSRIEVSLLSLNNKRPTVQELAQVLAQGLYTLTNTVRTLLKENTGADA